MYTEYINNFIASCHKTGNPVTTGIIKAELMTHFRLDSSSADKAIKVYKESK